MLDYRRLFRPTRLGARPHAILAVAAICAATDAEAERLAASARLATLRRERGEYRPLPSLAEALAYPYSDAERAADRARPRPAARGRAGDPAGAAGRHGRADPGRRADDRLGHSRSGRPARILRAAGAGLGPRRRLTGGLSRHARARAGPGGGDSGRAGSTLDAPARRRADRRRCSMGNRREFLTVTAAGLAAAAAPARAGEEDGSEGTPAGAGFGMPRDMTLINMRRGDGLRAGREDEGRRARRHGRGPGARDAGPGRHGRPAAERARPDAAGADRRGRGRPRRALPAERSRTSPTGRWSRGPRRSS